MSSKAFGRLAVVLMITALAVWWTPTARAAGPAMSTVQRYLPGPEKQNSTVLVEKTAPAQIRVGTEFEYQIKVTNISKATLEDVKVWDTVVDGHDIASAQPVASSTEGGWMTWEIGKLKPNESTTIKSTGSARRTGQLRPCAEVTFRMSQVCAIIDVVQPTLSLTKIAPSEMLLCDPIPIKFIITNMFLAIFCIF